MNLSRKRITVIGDGRITIPRSFRKSMGIRVGSILEGYIVKDKLVFEVLLK